jgi:glyoxylase-like metal-dependent hydrolase (beta-lactamase superfamily II)
MTTARDVSRFSRSLAVWQQYDAAVKADLWSAALRTDRAIYLADPIPLVSDELEQLIGNAPVAGVIVTNENHVRSAPFFCAKFSAPLLIHHDLMQLDHAAGCAITPLRDGELIGDSGLRVVEIPGAPRGEIALHFSAGDGAVIVGDALINFDPYGFTFLPDKYCVDAKLMRSSLRKLLEFSFEQMLFAHGTPIMRAARSKLENLLANAG